MARQTFRSLLTLVAGAACAMALCGNALAAKPNPSVYSDVQMTFAGQTYGFGGAQQSFNQSEDGGRIVFDVTSLGSPEYTPLPQIDTRGLSGAGNNWEVVTRLGHTTYTYVGTCASTTFSSSESGISVRHLFLNCDTLHTSVAR